MGRRVGAVVIALVVVTVCAELARGSSLGGQFLVATEKIRDPRFLHTVIYLVDHGPGGAMGLVVNRPVGSVPVAQVLEAFGLDAQGVTGGIDVHYGGPVQPGRGFVLHGADYTAPDTRVVGDGIALTTGRDILSAMARGTGPRRSLFVLGYAGWAPGQLEGEIGRDDWITVPADAALLFDTDHATKWERATARLRIRL